MSVLYSFTNFYMHGIHAGIQTAHLVHTIGQNEAWSADELAYNEWLASPTIKVLSGMDGDALDKLYVNMSHAARELHLPHGLWAEPALKGTTTAIGFIMPGEMIDYVNGMLKLRGRADTDWVYKKRRDEDETWEAKRLLYQLTKDYPLAI